MPATASSSSDGTTRVARRVAGVRAAAGALFLFACASAPPPGPAAHDPAEPASQKTAADPALQRDVVKLITQCEHTLGAAGQVVDTQFERVERETVVESWIVGRVGGEVVYQVKLTPGTDGVAVWVQCPPAPRVK